MRRRDSVVAADPEIRVLAVVEARRVSELHVVFIPEAAESFAVQSARERAAVHVFVVTAITTAADYAMLG